MKYNTWPGGSEVLGLVADNDVAVLHASGANVTQNRTIDSAILSLNHSFYVQNYNTGGATAGSDNLIINGVITQEYRGAVGTFSNGNLVTGYAKLYTYDARLKYLSPPYFLSPTSSAWGRLSYSELTPNPAP